MRRSGFCFTPVSLLVNRKLGRVDAHAVARDIHIALISSTEHHNAAVVFVHLTH